MIVSTIHFGSILVESLDIISTFQYGWLHNTVINIHHGENYRNQESKKHKKLFRRNSDVLNLQEKLLSGNSRVSTKQEAST